MKIALSIGVIPSDWRSHSHLQPVPSKACNYQLSSCPSISSLSLPFPFFSHPLEWPALGLVIGGLPREIALPDSNFDVNARILPSAPIFRISLSSRPSLTTELRRRFPFHPPEPKPVMHLTLIRVHCKRRATRGSESLFVQQPFAQGYRGVRPHRYGGL